MTGTAPHCRAYCQFALLEYSLSPTIARGCTSGPISRRIGKYGTSLSHRRSDRRQENDRQGLSSDGFLSRNRPLTVRGLVYLAPLAPAAETWARTTELLNICTRWADELRETKLSKQSSKTPALLNRSNRFQTEFYLPNRVGKARRMMLWTQK